MKSTVIDWDGSHLPAEMRNLPPGRYLIQPSDDPTTLSPEQESGIIAALDELDAGDAVPFADVLREIRSGSRK